MSENQVLCPVCDAENRNDADLCSVCGAQLHTENVKKEEKHDTGANIPQKRPVNTKRCRNLHQTAAQKENLPTSANEGLVVGAVALFLSFFLLLLNFLPIFSAEAVLGEDELPATLELSVLDGVIMGIDSLYFSSSKQIYVSELYKENQELKSELATKNSISRAECSKVLKNELRLALRNSSVDFGTGVFLNIFISATYMIFSLITFLCVLIRFLLLLAKKKAKRNFIARVLALSGFLPALYFFFRLSFNFGTKGNYSVFFTSSASLGWGLILALSFVFGSIIFFIAYTVIKRGGKPTPADSFKHGFSAIAALVLIVSVFLPVITFVPKESDANVDFPVNLADNTLLTDSESVYYSNISIPETKNAVNSSCEEYGLYLDGEISKHSGHFIEKNITEHIMRSRMVDNAITAYVLTLLFCPMFILGASSLFNKEILSLLYASEMKIGCKKAKKRALIFALLLLCAIIATFASALSSTDFYDFDKIFTTNIGIGAILFVLFSVILIFTLRKKRIRTEAGPEYDNPDTSYAPYVAQMPDKF